MRRAVEVALQNQVRLVHFLERVRLLADRHGQRRQTNRPAAEFDDDRLEDALVHFVEAIRVDLEHSQRLVGGAAVDAAIALHLRVVAHAAQEVVRDARRAPTATRHLGGSVGVDLDVEQPRGSPDDRLQIVGHIVVKPLAHGKARQQRRRQQAAPGRRADERKFRQIQPHAPGAWPLVDDDVQREILHRRVEIFLDVFLQPVNLVDEQHITLV